MISRPPRVRGKRQQHPVPDRSLELHMGPRGAQPTEPYFDDENPADRIQQVSAPAGSSSTKRGRAQLARDFYIELGYEPHQAAAIVGNLIQESGPGLNTTAEGDNGTAFGIAQWRHDRLDNLKNYASQKGTDWSDFQTQLEFVDWELKNKETDAYEGLIGAKDVTSATAAMIGYERPQGWSPGNPRGGHGWTSRLENAMGLMGGTYSEEEGASPESGYSAGKRLNDLMAVLDRPNPQGQRLAAMDFRSLFPEPQFKPLNLPQMPIPVMPTSSSGVGIGGGGSGGGGWGGPPVYTGDILPLSKYTDGVRFDPNAGVVGVANRWLDRLERTWAGEPVTEDAVEEAFDIAGLIAGLGTVIARAPANSLLSGAARKPLGELKFQRRKSNSDKWDITDSNGVIDLELVDVGNTIYVAWIGPKGKTTEQAYTSLIDYVGPTGLKKLLQAVEDTFPNALKLGGYRVSGARAKSNKEGYIEMQLPGRRRPRGQMAEQLSNQMSLVDRQMYDEARRLLAEGMSLTAVNNILTRRGLSPLPAE